MHYSIYLKTPKTSEKLRCSSCFYWCFYCPMPQKYFDKYKNILKMNKSNELRNGLVYENIDTLPSFSWMRKGHRSVKTKKIFFTLTEKLMWMIENLKFMSILFFL